MNILRNLIAAAALSFVVMGLPAIASAQYRDRDRDNDRYGNNGGYNNGGYYGNGQYGNSGYGDMRSIVRGLKYKSRDFQRQLDRDLDRSRYNGSRREDQMNDLAGRFRDAVNRLNDNDFYNNNGRYGNSGYNRGNDDIRRVMEYASQIDRSIGRADIGYNTRNIWSSIRSDLNYLGRGYNTGNGGWGNGRGNGNGNGGWGNGNGRSGMPSWWPF